MKVNLDKTVITVMTINGIESYEALLLSFFFSKKAKQILPNSGLV